MCLSRFRVKFSQKNLPYECCFPFLTGPIRTEISYWNFLHHFQARKTFTLLTVHVRLMLKTQEQDQFQKDDNPIPTLFHSARKPCAWKCGDEPWVSSRAYAWHAKDPSSGWEKPQRKTLNSHCQSVQTDMRSNSVQGNLIYLGHLTHQNQCKHLRMLRVNCWHGIIEATLYILQGCFCLVASQVWLSASPDGGQLPPFDLWSSCPQAQGKNEHCQLNWLLFCSSITYFIEIDYREGIAHWDQLGITSPPK